MAFVVRKLDAKTVETVESFHYAPLDVNISLKSFEDELFQRAYNLIGDRTRIELEHLKNQPKDLTFFNGIESNKGSTGELVILAVGEYLITDWDIVDEDGKKLEVSGENFKLLMANVDKIDQIPFLQWCLDRAGDIAISDAELLNDTKKKPLSASSGKKTTKA